MVYWCMAISEKTRLHKFLSKCLFLNVHRRIKVTLLSASVSSELPFCKTTLLRKQSVKRMLFYIVLAIKRYANRNVSFKAGLANYFSKLLMISEKSIYLQSYRVSHKKLPPCEQFHNNNNCLVLSNVNGNLLLKAHLDPSYDFTQFFCSSKDLQKIDALKRWEIYRRRCVPFLPCFTSQV